MRRDGGSSACCGAEVQSFVATIKLTRSGLGRKPGWLQELLAKGRTLEGLRINSLLPEFDI